MKKTLSMSAVKGKKQVEQRLEGVDVRQVETIDFTAYRNNFLSVKMTGTDCVLVTDVTKVATAGVYTGKLTVMSFDKKQLIFLIE